MKLFYHQTDGGAEYYCAKSVAGSNDEGDITTAVLRTDGNEIEVFGKKIKDLGIKLKVQPEGNIQEKPLTAEELKEAVDEDNYVSVIVPIGLNEFIDNDLEGVLDSLSEATTGSTLLMDISYAVVGTDDDGNLLVRVSGDATDILEENED